MHQYFVEIRWLIYFGKTSSRKQRRRMDDLAGYCREKFGGEICHLSVAEILGHDRDNCRREHQIGYHDRDSCRHENLVGCFGKMKGRQKD